MAEFWEDYLIFEDGRYVINNDALCEEITTKSVNNLLSLALVRVLFSGILGISHELGVDGELHEKWLHILKHISEFPTGERNGSLVFKSAEKGMEWQGGIVDLWNVFPTGQIGIGSAPHLIETAVNTFKELNIWDSGNGFCAYYAAGARIKYNPWILLDRLREQCLLRGLPNLFFNNEGGGIENCSGVTGCINEMLFQSYDGILRFSPAWPEDKSAQFIGLRGYGAFLASSEYKGGTVQYVCIESEKGRDCVVQNPWPGKKVRLIRNGSECCILEGEILSFKTSSGEMLELLPE